MLCISVRRLAARLNSAFSRSPRYSSRGWRGGGDDEFDVAVVELIDERNEAPRLVLMRGIEHRYSGEDDGLIGARDLDIIVLASRARAQRAEFKPDGGSADAHDGNRPAFDSDRATLPAIACGELAK